MSDNSQRPPDAIEVEPGEEATVDLSQLPELIAGLRAVGTATPVDPVLRATVAAQVDQAVVSWQDALPADSLRAPGLPENFPPIPTAGVPRPYREPQAIPPAPIAPYSRPE